jgi:hypothetical protein
MAYEYNRNLTDAAKTVTKAAPAAAANHNTPTIDLEQVTGGDIERIVCQVSIPATDTLVNTYAITIKLQDSADDSSYATVDPLIQTTVVGTAGNVSAAKTVRFRLPPGVRRYIQLNIAVPASAGDVTDTTVTFQLLF